MRLEPRYVFLERRDFFVESHDMVLERLPLASRVDDVVIRLNPAEFINQVRDRQGDEHQNGARHENAGWAVHMCR